MIESILDRTINKYDWGSLYNADGIAHEIPTRLLGLISAQDKVTAEYWYNLLENYVVVQGSVYESALPSIDVLIAGVKESQISDIAISWIYELIYQIVNGATAGEAVLRGNVSEVERCKELVTQNRELLKDRCPTMAIELFDWIIRKL